MRHLNGRTRPVLGNFAACNQQPAICNFFSLKNLTRFFYKFAICNLQYAICIFLFVFLSSCTGQNNQPETKNVGALAFALKWETSAASPSQKAGVYRAKTGDICVDYALSVIYGKVLNPGSSQVATAQWPCSAHQGIISNIPAGTGMTLVVEGTAEGSSTVEWRGQATGIEIKPGVTTVAPPVPIAPVPEITADVTPPAVTAKNPSSGAANVPVTSKITVNFSKQMAAWTIMDAAAFKVKKGEAAGSIAGNIAYNPATKAASFSPTANLDYSTSYTVVLTTAIKDLLEQRGLVSDVTWSFSTEIQPGAAPPAPAIAALVTGEGQCTVTWSPVIGAQSYNLYWSTGSCTTPLTCGQTLTSVTSPYVHSGLNTDSKYYYVAKARNATGESAGSNQITISLPPAAPTSVIATPGSGQNTITWNPVQGATVYNIYYSQSSGVTVQNGTKLSNVANPYTHLGLTNGQQYFYVVTALSANGESFPSQQVSATPAPPGGDTSAPSVPTGLTVTAVSSTQINLSWIASTDNIGVVKYNIFRSYNPTPGYGDEAMLAPVTVTTAQDTGLSPSTQYCYTVQAVDAANNPSGKSSRTCATTYSAGSPPSAPGSAVAASTNGQIGSINPTRAACNECHVNISYVNPAPTGMTLHTTGARSDDSQCAICHDTQSQTNLHSAVTPPATIITWNAVPGATSYNIYWSTNPANATKTLGTKIANAAVPYAHTSLAYGTRYYYVVTAVNGYGESGDSNQTSAMPLQPADTTPPTTPQNLVATPMSTSQIDLSWSASTDFVGVTGYRIYRDGIYIETVTGVSASDMSLTASTDYCYTVSAVDAENNESMQSSQACATTQQATPPPPPAP